MQQRVVGAGLRAPGFDSLPYTYVYVNVGVLVLVLKLVLLLVRWFLHYMQMQMHVHIRVCMYIYTFIQRKETERDGASVCEVYVLRGIEDIIGEVFEGPHFRRPSGQLRIAKCKRDSHVALFR